MNKMRRIARAFLAACLVSLTGPVGAEEAGKLPYPYVYEWLQWFAEQERFDLLALDVYLISELDGVRPADIRLTIDTPEGQQVFQPEQNGVIQLPFREDWNAAGYQLTANQPRGTLKLEFRLNPRRMPLRVPYRRLLGVVPQLQRASTLLAERAGTPAPHELIGLAMQFEKDGGALTIHSAAGEQVLKANEKRELIILMDDTLWAENPALVFNMPLTTLVGWTGIPAPTP